MERHWIKTYGDAIPSEISPDAFSSVVAMLDDAMAAYGEKVAFHNLGASLTYSDVDRHSGAFAAFLQTRLGLRKGDRVAVMSPNVIAFPIAMIGILRAGGVQVNVNPLYTPQELKHQLNDAGVEIIVIFGGSTPTLAEVINSTPIKTVITVDLGDCGSQDIPSPAIDVGIPEPIKFADALVEGESLAFKAPEVTGEDIIFLQYTGGTTGLSKGAVLTHRNLVANTEQFKAMMPDALRSGKEIVVTALPLYHVFALMVNLISYFSVGAENHLIANPRDPEMLIGTYKRARFSVSTGVNTLIEGLVSHPDFQSADFSNYRVMIGGGAPVLPSTSAKWKKITGKNILEGYGLSETSPILCINPMTIEGFSGTVGLPVPSTEIILLDDNDKQVGIGEAGEVCARGPQVMRGYWNRPDDTKDAFTEDGFFRTGDIGQFDEQGYLKIVDRKKDMILVSGFNVFPNEIEAHIASLNGIVDCACIGMSDEKSGEAVCLFAVKATGAQLDVETIIAHCRKGLAGYKVPRHIRFLDELPKSNVGKILRRKLRDLV